MKNVYLRSLLASLLVLSFFTAQTQESKTGKREKLVLPTPSTHAHGTHSFANHQTPSAMFARPVKKGEIITLVFDHFVSTEDSEITVINMIGKLILNQKITAETFKLEVGERFVDGVYLVKIKQGEKRKVERLVVK